MRWQQLSLFLALTFLAPASAPSSTLQSTFRPTRHARGAKSANLQETLEKGLRARLPEEFEFLERVVQMVEKGTLPLDLVRSTFDWARDKRPYPYRYFERGLKLRAARIGIEVR
jgi:hypothetical protein